MKHKQKTPLKPQGKLPKNMDFALEALLKSIEHWEKDVVKQLKKDKIKEDFYSNLYWVKSGDMVSCYATDCPLCEKFYGCGRCPLVIYTNNQCMAEGSVWSNFRNKPTQANAKKMVAMLKKALKMYRIDNKIKR